MTKLQRLGNLLLALVMIAGGIVMPLFPQDGIMVVAVIMAAGLMLYGVGKLVYYLRMARHMTGGLTALFMAVIAIDVSALGVAVIAENPRYAIALYLSTYSIVSGVVSIARGLEAKMYGSPWIMNVAFGLVDLALASLCTSFINSSEAIVLILSIGLFYNAGVRLVSAFKPTDIIFIQ